MTASKPTILVEVPSPTTSQIGFSDKFDEGLEAVEIILLVDPTSSRSKTIAGPRIAAAHRAASPNSAPFSRSSTPRSP